MNDSLNPSPSNLAIAPRLERWRTVTDRNSTRLRGEVTGHPILFDQRIVTSPLLALDQDKKWARTISRYYVLGEPAVSEPSSSKVAHYKKRLAEASPRVLHHQHYQLSDYPAIARVMARRTTATKLDGRSILAVMETAHPTDLAALNEDERTLLNQLRVKRDGLAF
ncbi:DUF6634 family protein [Aliiroseovarius sp. 2305UL8-7]|uniref:DUF6634 family protein n=1 Tax=Aliiroseovarius conchicola TaxID=3121637 RepID=UPI0035286A98